MISSIKVLSATVCVLAQSCDLDNWPHGIALGEQLYRSSALMDERLGRDWQPTLVTPVTWRQVTFLFSKHMDLTKDPAFIDNMLYMLLESPRN